MEIKNKMKTKNFKTQIRKTFSNGKSRKVFNSSSFLSFVFMAFLLFAVATPLLITIPLLNAEMTLSQATSINNQESIVYTNLIATFEDTSDRNIGNDKVIKTELHYSVEALPYDLYGAGEIDWCNLTTNYIEHTYTYGTGLVEISSVDVSNSYYFANNSFTSSKIDFEFLNRDYLSATMKCHYTNSSQLYIDNVLVGRLYLIAPSFECKGCEGYNLEQLSDEIAREEDNFNEEISIHTIILSIIDMNFFLWSAISWIVKIGFILIAISLIFYGGYSLYVFLMGIAERIKNS